MRNRFSERYDRVILHHMQPNDRPINRVTVKQAADIMGITPEAVRARLFRGTLQRETGEDGTVWVLLRPDQAQPDDDHSQDHSHDQSVLVEHLDSEVEFLRSELHNQAERHAEETRELRRLIAALTQRIPEQLPAAPPEQDQGHRESRQEAPQTASKDDLGGSDQGTGSPPQRAAEPRSLWRRIFG